MKFNNAFTLIEVLIVVGIMGILTMSVLPAFGTFADRRAFQSSVDIFAEKVRSARTKAMSGVASSGTDVNWYIEPTSGGTGFVIGHTTVSGGISTAVFNDSLSGYGVTFGSCSPCRITFQRLTGKRLSGNSDDPQTILLNFSKSGESLTKSINVYDSGKIEVQ